MWGLATALGNLGDRLQAEANFPGAVEAWQDSLAAAQRFQGKWAIARAQQDLGRAYLAQGNLEAARTALEAAHGFYGDKEALMGLLAQTGSDLADVSETLPSLE